MRQDSADIIGVLLVSVSTDEILKNRLNMIDNAALFMLILSVFVVIFAAFGAVGISRPFKRLASRIEQVHVGIEDELIPEEAFGGYFSQGHKSPRTHEDNGRVKTGLCVQCLT